MADSRFFPSSFDPNDASLHGVSRDLSWRWERLERALLRWNSHAVMLRLPLFWQMEIPVFHACRRAGALLFTNDAENMPLGKAAIAMADIDTVVTDVDDAARFAEHLAHANVTIPPNWFIVKPQQRKDTPIPTPLQNLGNVETEVHESPGVPIHAS